MQLIKTMRLHWKTEGEKIIKEQAKRYNMQIQ